MTPPIDELTTRTFTIVRKGYDRHEVRAYLDALAFELNQPLDGGGDAGPGPVDLQHPAAADAGELDRLRTERDELAAALDAQRRAHESELSDLLAESASRVASAETRAAEGPWRGAGESVARVLAAAHEEAAGLVETAEVIAMEIRSKLQEELAQRRAEAHEEADQLRAEAETFADQRRASVESDLEESTALVEANRSEAARVTSDAQEEAAGILERARRDAEAEANDLLDRARSEAERANASRTEATARLQRVHRLVTKALEAAGLETSEGLDQANGSLSTG